MTKNTPLISSIAFCLILTACGAGGGRNLGGGGLFCPAGQYKTLFAVPKKAEVVSEDADELGQLELGDYKLRNAEYLHVKKVEPDNNRRWIMFQVNESVDENDNRRTRRYCARGVQTEDESFVSEAPGIDTMTVGEGNKVDFSPRVWGFQYNSEKLLLEHPYCKDGSEACEISEKTSFSGKLEPGDFEDASAVLKAFGDEIKIVKLNKPKAKSAQRYQILLRSVYTDEDGFENIVVLRLSYLFSAPDEAEEDDEDVAKSSDNSTLFFDEEGPI